MQNHKLVVPTITATEAHGFRSQTELIASISEFAHLDLAEEGFCSASPLLGFQQTYLDPALTYSIHLMYQSPLQAVEYFLASPKRPRMIILQAESDLEESVLKIKQSVAMFGLALLQESKPEDFEDLIKLADQVLIFSGNLGEHGGSADLSLTAKIEQVKKINPRAEIAWDGGVSKQNIAELSKAGVDIFYAGGAIHSAEDPASALRELQDIVENAV